MSVRLGNRIIAGGQPINKSALYLFDFKWADHQINQMEWIRADTFTWHDGTVYKDAYQHLLDDIDGKTLTSETIGTTTIQFYLADDGHKVCPSSEEANVATIFLDTGVAWYYILDTTNQQFKLPRTQHNIVGARGAVGNYVEPGLPNITGGFAISDNVAVNGNDVPKVTPSTGAMSTTTRTANTVSLNANTFTVVRDTWDGRVDFDASLSSSVYGNSSTVQPPATEMYLYFYVGEFTQTATEQTAGITSEALNSKADVSMFQVVTALPTNPNPGTIYFVVNP